LALQPSPTVQPLPSLHALPGVFGAARHRSSSSSQEPMRQLFAPVVHGSAPPTQPPAPLQRSPPVQNEPSSHAAVSPAKPPATQKPSSQRSPVVQALPSSHAMSLASTKSQPPPAWHVGVLHASPVSQSSPTGSCIPEVLLDSVVVPSLAAARHAARSQSWSPLMVALPVVSAPPLSAQ